MLFKVFTILLLILILASLFSGLYFLIKKEKSSEDQAKVAKALTIRISLSIGLFVLLLLSLLISKIAAN